jgi:peptidoglycan/LPS O-acetylase OafA/YrhL
MNYIKQLDGLRAIAVCLVIIWHWIPRNSFIENLHAGALGVNIFFVLSGFLITKILLENRFKAENQNDTRVNVLKSFYVRRVLRIFPIYYLCILLTVFLNSTLTLHVTRSEVLSNLTYTSNFFIFHTKLWPFSSLHFWSLAVEEQFYLAWPLIMLFWPKKYLLPAILCFISAGLVSQLLTTNEEFGHLPTNTCLDCFGIGGLVAFIVVHQRQRLNNIFLLLSIFSIAGSIVLLVCWYFHFYLSCTRFVHAIISGWVITYILLYRNNKSVFNSVLTNKLVVSIGKVSYGIYLYHLLYVYGFSKLWYNYVFDYYEPFIDKRFEPWIFLLINFWGLYFVAWLSWRFIEMPFLSLKRKFRYEKIPSTYKLNYLKQNEEVT